MLSRTAPKSLLVVLLLLLCSACGDSPVSPQELTARESQQSLDRMGERELLMAVLERLDSIESRLARETEELRTHFDELAEGGTVVLAAAPGNSGDRGNEDGGGGGGGMSAQMDELLALGDSIFEVASWMAAGQAKPWRGFQLCGNFGAQIGADLKSLTAVKADAEGGVGVKPWDTGAMAQIALKQRYAIDMGAGAALGLGAVACYDLSNLAADPPPVRTEPTSGSSVMAASSMGQELEQTLVSLSDQMGLDPQGMERALSEGIGVLQSGDFSRLANLPSVLPTPSQFQDPLGHLRSRMSDFNPIQDLLCGGGSGWGQFAAEVQEACSFIQAGNLPNLGAYLTMGDNFAMVQSTVGSLVNSDLWACQRFNGHARYRFTIPENTFVRWFGGGGDEWTTRLYTDSSGSAWSTRNCSSSTLHPHWVTN